TLHSIHTGLLATPQPKKPAPARSNPRKSTSKSASKKPDSPPTTIPAESIPSPAAVQSVAVDDDGRIFVSDARRNRILTFNARGRASGPLPDKSSPAKSGAKLSPPLGASAVAASPDGYLYVADPSRHWLARVTSSGTIQNTWSWTPSTSPAVSLDAASPATAADSAHAASFGSSAEICFLAITQKSVVLVTAIPNGTAPVIHIFIPDGREPISKPLTEIDPSASTIIVGGIAATADGQLLILDVAAPRVLRFRLN
ncbi:MAG: hypothetical protein ACRD5L_04960, partial [Bryobacteraceae bacterium]